ncbi:hypothetical protein HDV00_008437 [Rhizophlyctis rosea]|nr:hypothetical protein HDV00_008437 [Rhizophlyctis rosea]
MKNTLTPLSLLSILSLAAAATAPDCSSTFDLSTRFANLTVDFIQTVNFYNQSTFNETTNTNTTSRVYFNVTGTATILNPCSFTVTNFTYNPILNNTEWIGKEFGNYTIGSSISYGTDGFGGVPQLVNDSYTFTLLPNITFEKIDTVILYSRFYGLQLAYAQFPRNKTTGSTKGGSGNMSYWEDQKSSGEATSPIQGTRFWVAILSAFLFSFFM